MKKEKFKPEPVVPSKWERAFQKYKKRTDEMFQSVSDLVMEIEESHHRFP